jgi:hypothetical protein
MKALLLIIFSSIALNAQVNFKAPTTAGPTPWTNLQFNDKPGQFQFAIVTDRTGGHRPGVFEDGVKKLNLLQPEFVMSVGDLIEGYTKDTVRLKTEWDEFDGFIDELKMPFFYLPGNHDYTNEVMRDVWAKRYGPDHYYFIYQDVLFLCLNSEDNMRGSPKGSIGDEQYEWIKKVLAENEQVKWTMVFMHQPLWVQEVDPMRWFDVEELLKPRKHTVFVGHRHNYVAYERNNSSYYILATTGGGSALRGPQLGEFDHLVWVTMTEEGPIMANLALNGIYDDQLFTSDMKAFSSKVLESKMIAIEPLKLTNGSGTAQIKLTNDLNIPISIKLSNAFNWDLKTDIENAELELAPNSVAFANLNVNPRKAKDIADLAAIKIKALVKIPQHENLPAMEIPFTMEIKPE